MSTIVETALIQVISAIYEASIRIIAAAETA
jgi:hypothetical protein